MEDGENHKDEKVVTITRMIVMRRRLRKRMMTMGLRLMRKNGRRTRKRWR